MNKLSCFLLLFLSITQLRAQVLPKENAALNYRLVGMSFPGRQNVYKYKIEIAAGNWSSEDSFKNNIFLSLYSKVSKIIAEVPAFKAHYTWRYTYIDKHGRTDIGKWNHFSTLTCPEVDTSLSRLRVIKTTEKYKNAYVFVDCKRTVYDMKGRPVWFLPDNKAETEGAPKPRDMKISSAGTVTYLWHGGVPYEVNYDGDILWKAPDDGKVSGQKKEDYHHEFTRLANGHYFVLGSEPGYLVRSGAGNPAADTPIKVTYGTLIEYNQAGVPV